MSFGDNVKSELLGALPQRTCCRRSYLHGLLINAENGVAGMVMCRIKGEKTAETVKKLLLEQYGRAPETRNENCYGRAVCVFEFESKRLFLKSCRTPLIFRMRYPSLSVRSAAVHLPPELSRLPRVFAIRKRRCAWR